MPDTDRKYLFLGDSLTEFGNWEKLLGKPGFINQGISGDVTRGVLNRLDRVIKANPQKIFLLIGVNDLASRIPDDQILENIFRIIENIKKELPETTIYLQSLLPINPTVTGFNDNFDYSANIVQINARLKNNHPNPGYIFLDLYPQFTDTKERLATVYTTDGLHLNEKGYELWAEILKKNVHL